jgi:chromosomal replication initiation ATPase DnaA
VTSEFGTIARFHEFVLEGNDKALENFYNKGRQSPVLGDEEFRNGLMEKPIRIDRGHPRYERTAVKPSIDQVLKTLATRYGLKVEDFMKGKRGKDNEPRKIGMYLAKELCDLKLKEIAEHFGTASYGTVGWACHGVASRMQADAKFRDRVSSIRRICQQKI